MSEANLKKTLKINLPDEDYNCLIDLASKHGITMTTLIQVALGLVKICYEETQEKGKHIVVVGKEDSKITKQIILPRN